MVLVNVTMDNEEKKRISNEKRLRAIKEWKKNQSIQKVKPINSRKILDSDVTPNTNTQNKPKLFESDGEDEGDKFGECFSARPQFDGPHGKKMLEMNLQLPTHLKLDARYKEEDEPETSGDGVKEEIGEDREKEKNMKILQSVLGYEVLTKESKSSPKKRQIRYDPDDENASKYVKTSKSKSKNQQEEPSIPISMERYIEVSCNLKEILSAPSTPFSFTKNFTHAAPDSDVEEEEIKTDHFEDNFLKKKSEPYQELSSGDFVPRIKDSFFIKEGDPRLKKGVEFFKRPKPLEEIREEWHTKREYVLELFRRKKRSGQRSHPTKVQTIQAKNAIRKQNFKK